MRYDSMNIYIAMGIHCTMLYGRAGMYGRLLSNNVATMIWYVLHTLLVCNYILYVCKYMFR